MSQASATPQELDRQELHRRMDAEISAIIAGAEKSRAETAKISAETSRINEENKHYPWMAILALVMPTVFGSIGIIGAIVALVVAFHK